MNPVVEQFLNIFKKMPVSRKIVLGAIVFLVVVGFLGLFILANRVEYKTVYSNLSLDDASSIVEKLKEGQIPYKMAGDGSVIRVPTGNVYDARLMLASFGLPKGSGVGYEIFDKSDFGVTEFVQNINYKRALQGELARTIKEFDEVVDARVMIVMPKDSVFIEDTRPPTASVLLNLKSNISKGRIDAVVHLVSNSVENLSQEYISVVDTKGRVLYKGSTEEELAGEIAGQLLKYKNGLEQNLSKRIETMLERIVGTDNAIVRVTSDIDFNQVDTNEELYDPDVQVVRSSKSEKGTSTKELDQGIPSSVNPVISQDDSLGENRLLESANNQNNTLNYEINKTIKRTVKPIAVVQRLSVAAVINGTFETEVTEEGGTVRKYVPRTAAEMQQFQKIVEKAMGYNEDRGDQVTVETFSFSGIEDMVAAVDIFSPREIWKNYGKLIANAFLLLLLAFLVIRPVIKTVKDIKNTIDKDTALALEGEKLLIEEDKKKKLPEILVAVTPSEKAKILAKQDIMKTTNILKGWLMEDY